MAQKLIYPLKNVIVSAGYKNSNYLKQFKFNHFGWDMGCHEDKNIYSPGDGTIIACGADGKTPSQRLGNVVVILYPQCEYKGKYIDIVCRMFHLASVKVKSGQKVKQGDILGIYGNTGANTTGPHLHIEFDTDTKYPCYAYGVSSGGLIIKHGTIDSTLNPVDIMYLNNFQNITFPDKDWVSTYEIGNVLKSSEAVDKSTKSNMLDLINEMEILLERMKDECKKN